MKRGTMFETTRANGVLRIFNHLLRISTLIIIGCPTMNNDCPRRTCILAGGPCFTQIKENATQFFCTNCTVFEKLDREYLDCVTEFINTKSDEANKKVRLVYQAKDANKTVTFSIGNIINSSDEWNKDHGYHLSWTVFKHSTTRSPYSISILFQSPPCNRNECPVATQIIAGLLKIPCFGIQTA